MNLKTGILCLVLCSVIFSCPVYAAGLFTIYSSNTSQISYEPGYVLYSDTYSVGSNDALEICTKYGYSSVYSDYYSKFMVRNKIGGAWVGANSGVTGSYPRNFSLSLTGADPATHDMIGYTATCFSPGDTYHLYKVYPLYNTSADIPQTDVNFTGYPLDGYSPLGVSFTITNFSSGVKLGSVSEWSFGDGEKEYSTAETINHTYDEPGIYSVSLQFWNVSNTSITISKPDYVLASTPSGMVVNLDVKNGLTGALIQDATVGIKNTSTGVWRNTTAPTGLVYFTSTDPGYLYPLSQGQSITLAANKSGYKDASETFAIPYNNYRARLFLMPDSIANETGAGTVVVNVIRNKDGLTVSGMSVVMDTGQVGLTNTAGATTLFNVTAGNRVVKVSDPDGGYMPTEKSFNLTAGETKLVVVEVVRVGETPVTTPVSPTPTPQGTYDPDDPNSPVYGNYTTSEINEQGGAGVLGMLAQVIQLWPLAIVMLLMKALRSAMT